MKVLKILLGALVVAVVSVVYNFFIFYIFDFYPDIFFEFGFLNNYEFGFLIVIFLKNYLVGLVLMVLFSTAYSHIIKDKLTGDDAAIGTVFFILYAIFALFSFTIGDMLLMRSNEGMLVLLTVDGVVEAFIATVPVKIFAVKK